MFLLQMVLSVHMLNGFSFWTFFVQFAKYAARRLGVTGRPVAGEPVTVGNFKSHRTESGRKFSVL